MVLTSFRESNFIEHPQSFVSFWCFQNTHIEKYERIPIEKGKIYILISKSHDASCLPLQLPFYLIEAHAHL